MAQFVRGKQAGISNDLSAGLVPDIFAVDLVARYGINSQTTALAFEPIQSLLALGTKSSRFDGGQIYVFGQKRVCITFTPQRNCSIERLEFCADKLVSVDSRNDVSVYSLLKNCLLYSYSPPGRVTALATDPSIDYAFIGLQNGTVIAYDMERGQVTPFRVADLWREVDPRARMVPVVSLSLHPRDIGTLLIGFSEGAAVFSFKLNKATQFFRYELPPGAPGGGGLPDLASGQKSRRPKLVQAVWHPTGTFILTGHEDGSLVIWDPKTAKIIEARTIQKSGVHQRGPASGGPVPTTPLVKIAWCAKQNPDDTGILVAGGDPMDSPDRGLSFMELGPTPVYATSSWQVLTEHFARPKKQSVLPTPPDAEVLDFCMIPRASPYFAGCQDPVAVIAIISSGELVTMSFPSGYPITPSNQLHVSMSFVHPFVNSIASSTVERARWLGLSESRPSGPPLLVGGAEAPRRAKRFEGRNILQVSHADGIVRIWDTGAGDEIENPNVIQVDVARAVGRMDNVDVLRTSFAGAAGELATGLRSGEVVIFRWDKNPNYGREPPFSAEENLGLLAMIENADPGLKQGLLPLTMFPGTGAACTALQMSEIGFCAAGFENGALAVIDLRGPALIYDANLTDTAKMDRRRSIRRSNSQSTGGRSDYATTIEFGIMNLDEETYSSILLFVGTSSGRILTFKIAPESNGAFTVQPAGATSVDSSVVLIHPLSVQTGEPAKASQQAFGNLRSGQAVDGVLVAVSKAGARIFKPASAKGAHKSWSDVICDVAAVVRSDNRTALLGVFGDGTAKTFSLPGLKELSSLPIDKVLDVRRFPEALITPNADIVGWTGPSEIAIVNPWGSGIDNSHPNDSLLNPDLTLPPRPTISNVQWMSGTQYVTPADLEVLIGGPNRRPSERVVEQTRAQQQGQRGAAYASASSRASNQQDEGYWGYVSRQMQERTERLNITGDAMDRLETQSAQWAEDVGKFVSQQKRKAAMGLVTKGLGF